MQAVRARSGCTWCRCGGRPRTSSPSRSWRRWALREAIRSGRLAPGTRLPPYRSLAVDRRPAGPDEESRRR
nr:GntR family transcriptional regulator [Saccharopolyspora spinosa]